MNLLGINIPQQTPTAFLFFVASGAATYYSGEVDFLRWFA